VEQRCGGFDNLLFPTAASAADLTPEGPGFRAFFRVSPLFLVAISGRAARRGLAGNRRLPGNLERGLKKILYKKAYQDKNPVL
jgi:hypothetical protein